MRPAAANIAGDEEKEGELKLHLLLLISSLPLAKQYSQYARKHLDCKNNYYYIPHQVNFKLYLPSEEKS